MKMAQPTRKGRVFNKLCFFSFWTICCGHSLATKIHDSCLELSKIEVLKMLDLQTKSAIDSNNLQV